MRPGHNGELRLNETGEVIGPGTMAADFSESRAAAKANIRFGVDRTEVDLGACVLEGTRCASVALRFEGARLGRMDVMLALPGDETGGVQWTLEGEQLRKRLHEQWLESVFGERLAVKAVEGVVPFEPGWDQPRHASFEWGEVASYYDGKGGCSYACIHFHPTHEGGTT